MKVRIIAPKEFWEDTEYEGRCGVEGLWVFPQTIFGLSILVACKIHDWMYDYADKKAADAVFRRNLIAIITAGSKNRIAFYCRYGVALMMILAVHYIGWMFYRSENQPKTDYEERDYKL